MSSASRFAHKSMVVTGAAQGIGKQVAIDAAGEGARVTLIDRSPLVESVAAEITRSGGQAVAMIADLETWDGNVEAMKAAHKAHGAIDILVTNVGGAIWMKPFQHFDEKQIVAEVQRSLFPTLWGCRAALPYMLDQGRGAIVNVSSVATKGVNRAPYSAAKGAVNALTASLGLNWGQRISASTRSPQEGRLRRPAPYHAMLLPRVTTRKAGSRRLSPRRSGQVI